MYNIPGKRRGILIFDIKKLEDSNNIEALKKAAIKNDEEISKIVKDTNELKKDSSLKNNFSSLATSNKTTIKKALTDGVNKRVKKIDVSYYISNLQCCSELSDLYAFMPDDKNPFFQDIITCILLELQKMFVLNSKLLNEKKNEKEREKLECNLEKLKTLKFLVNKYVFINNKTGEDDEVIYQDDTSSNFTLLYTKTDAGNVSLLRDFESIAKEQYNDFLCLFESLLVGQLKNPRVLFKDNFSDSFTEVKKNQARITFERPTGNFIVVTGAFCKKVRKSSLSCKTLARIKTTYNKNEPYILENLNNPVFIDEQTEITKEVLHILRREK